MSKTDTNQNNNMKDEKREMAEEYYKKIMRIVEYYVLICFILISFVPLLEFSWVQAATRFIYMTGFPALILLFVVSLVKEPLLNFATKIAKK